jgi:AhpC/TSA family
MRLGWLAVVAAVVLLGWVTFNTVRSKGVGSEGLAVGRRMPPFAAPLALSGLDGDVNVARRADQGAAGRRPACSVRGPDVLNICALYERRPVVLAFLATRGARCTRELDRLQRLRARHRGVAFAAVSIRGDRDELRATIRRHRWTFPVGYDRDGALANLYGVAVCPTITYALPGGVVHGTTLGELDLAGLGARVAALERAARARGWRP